MRRSTDSGEPSNREILNRLNDFIVQHGRDHSDLEARFASNAVALASRSAASDTALASRLAASDIASAVSRTDIAALQLVAVDVKLLHDFRIQVETLGKMTRWITGGSLLAALASIAAFIVMLLHIGATGQP